jgi:cyclase
MPKHLVSLAVVVSVFVLAVLAAEPQKVPDMKFNDVTEIAPGVFFRYSSISATDPKVVFGGSNNVWVVFKDYVVVIDANFPKEAGDVLAAIRKTTDKPIKYVLDTHHHGDHAYGNCVWSREGARIIASAHAARLLKDNELKQVDTPFDDKSVLDDGTQRVEFLTFGHSHTIGDAVAYLPKQRILCTGDACVNGAFNFMGHSNSESWITCLEKMQKLDIDLVCPGHGKVAGKDLLDKQKRYFTELRQEVKKGVDAGKTPDEIADGLRIDWYEQWTGKAAKTNKDHVKHVYAELTGKINHQLLGMQSAPLDYRSRDPFAPALVRSK